MPAPISAFTACWPGKVSGAPETSPCSLAKATIEPVKVIAPMASPSPISISERTSIAPGAPMP